MSLNPLLLQHIFNQNVNGNPQTKTGWQALVRNQQPPRPPLLTRAQHKTMPNPDGYDIDRMIYHASLTMIHTPQMLTAHKALDDKLTALITPGIVARNGIILSGPTQSGKSTSMILWGKQLEQAARQQLNQPLQPAGAPPLRQANGAEFLPVANFAATDSVNETMSNALAFYDAIPPSRFKAEQAVRMFARHVQECQTRVVLIDQLQEIAQARKGPAGVSGLIKSMMDKCTGTLFVGAGIGVEHLRIFSDGRTEQLSNLGQTGGRFSLVPVPSMTPHDTQSQQVWDAFLATLDTAFVLLDHQTGDIPHLSKYLLQRTGGRTGAVIALLRDAANRAIQQRVDGTATKERITEALLNQVTSGAQADLRSGIVRPATPKTTRGAA